MVNLTAQMARDAYEAAIASSDGLAGYYNRNYRVHTPAGTVLVRIPIAGADEMDIRRFPEHETLRIARQHGVFAPEVLYLSQEPPYEIHQYIDGVRGDTALALDCPLPPHFLGDIVSTLKALHNVTHQELPTVSGAWPADGDTDGFFRRLVYNTQRVYDESVDTYGWLYDRIGVPTDPLTQLISESEQLQSRPFRLCHCDIHRKNIIINDSRTWLLDWEHALWGDPVYDLAVHLHKMTYRPEDETKFLDLAVSVLDRDTTQGVQTDCALYRRHERMKSVIVDTIRYRKQATAPHSSDAGIIALASKLAPKTAATVPLWGNRALSVDEAVALLKS